MNIYEFLTQSPKKIGKDLREAGIDKYNSLPTKQEELCKKLNLEPDSRVTRYSTITRGGATEWYIILNLDFSADIKNVNIPLQYYVKGKCTVELHRLGEFHNYIKIYEKICPLFDNRENYHNLEFKIEGEEFVQFEKSRYGDDKVPVYDNNKSLSEYISIITEKSIKYKPYINRIEEMCFDGQYENAYNKYHFNKFKTGNMIISEDPGFSGSVHALFNAKELFDLDLSIDNIQGIYAYLWKNIDEYRQYYNDKSIDKPLVAFIRDLFEHKVDENLTKEIILKLIDLANEKCLINKDIESWDSLYLKANKEFYYGFKELAKQIADKYKIPVEFVNVFSYNVDTDTCKTPKIPDELKSRFE